MDGTTIFDQAVPWMNGEDAGLVFQGSAVRAPAQEIFHSNPVGPRLLSWCTISANISVYVRTVCCVVSVCEGRERILLIGICYDQ